MIIKHDTPDVPSLKDAVVQGQGNQQHKSNLKLVGAAWEVKNGALQLQLQGIDGVTIGFNPQNKLRLVIFRAKTKKTPKSPTHLVYLDESKPQ